MKKILFWLIVAFIIPDVLLAQEQLHPYQPGIDALHYSFRLQIADSGKSFTGTAAITIRRTASVNVARMNLVGMTVTGVQRFGEQCPIVQDSVSVTVPLPPYGSRSDTIRVVIHYSGTPKDGLIYKTTKTGQWTLFGDNWPDRARYWLPCIDHPSDKATVEWSVEAPGSQTVVANGELVEVVPMTKDAVRPIRARTVWRTDVPIPTYTMVIAVAPLLRYDLGLTAAGLSTSRAGVNQMVYVYPGVEKSLPGAFTNAAAIVEFFARTIGPFPYEKLAHVQSSTRYGGMENSSAIFYNEHAFNQGWMSAELIAHETSHQWFGDDVTPREWGHVWLSEGFATYFTALWIRESKGEKAFLEIMERSRREILNAPVVKNRPVIDTTQVYLMQLLNTNSYSKGAWVLHMLRQFLGDEVFLKVIKSYYRRFQHLPAISDDLMAEVERYTSGSWRWFFDQWLRKPGYIDCTLTWNYDGTSRVLSTTVQQSKRFGFYRFPLIIDIEFTDGSSERRTIDVPPEERVVLRIPLASEAQPKRLRFDPDVQLLAKISEQ